MFRKSTIPISLIYSRKMSTATLKQLRDLSGAPMMDCKKALMDKENNGDIQKAMDWLRAKGKAKAASGANRDSFEGLITIIKKESSQSITGLEVNSETDFVSRNKNFQIFVANIASTCSTKFSIGAVPIEKLKENELVPYEMNSSSVTVQDSLDDIINVIRENIVIRRAEVFESSQALSSDRISIITSYVHNKVGIDWLPSSIQMGRSASVVSLYAKNVPANMNQEIFKEVLLAEGHKLAMHVVAAAPMYLSEEDVPSDVIHREMAILKEQYNNELENNSINKKQKPKSPEMVEKILTGKLNKRLAEICLLSQGHVAVDGSPVVSKHLQSIENQLGGCSVGIEKFHLWKLSQQQL